MKYKISEMSWETFKTLTKTRKLAIIPVGAIECYGPHLPLGTDTLVAEKLSEIIAPKVDAFIAPTLSFGDSTSMHHFPGTLIATPESFKGYFNDLIRSLLGWGIEKILVINGHAGNTAMVNQVCYQCLREQPKLEMLQVDWWRYAMANSQDIFEEKGYMAHGHASECATSVMLYLYPDLVDKEKISVSIPAVVNSRRYPNLIKYTNFESFSEKGMIGNAEAGTFERGETLINRCVTNIIESLEALNG